MRDALRALFAGLVISAALTGGPVPAQEAASLPFATLNEARLLAGTSFGKQILQKFETAQLALAAENRRIEADLATREQELTRQRSVLAPEDFRRQTDKFNSEVETFRRTQADKERALYLQHDEDRQRFRLLSNETLTELMRDRGIQAIISEDAIVLAFRGVDITDALIERIDAAPPPGPELQDPATEGGEAPGAAAEN